MSAISNESFIGRALRVPLRLIPRSAVIPILQGTLRGKKWVVGTGQHGCWIGTYEQAKQDALKDYVVPGGVAYDIGANVGFYSLLASVLVGDAGHVYSFDPLPQNVRDLRRHLELNHAANCTVIEAAVSSVDGTATFNAAGDRYEGRLAPDGTLEVRTVALDRFARTEHFRPPTLMKIDIEGAEYECLKGASGLIQESRPVIFLATHGSEVHNRCAELLASWGYQLKGIGGAPPEATDELIALPAKAAV